MLNMEEINKQSGKWLIDTDPGVDDSFCIILAHKFIREHLIALSIASGNIGLDATYNNAKKITSICENTSIPIFKGTDLNLSCTNFRAPVAAHGHDGLYDLEEFSGLEKKHTHQNREDPNFLYSNFSPFKLIEIIYKYEKEGINLLCLGPLTNLAIAYSICPEIVNKINRLVIMGGAYKSYGNICPGAEFNFFYDPIAAKIVVSNFKNVQIFPWETCELNLFKEEELEYCKYDNNRSLFCRRCIESKLSFKRNLVFADYGAGTAAFNPKIITKSRKTNGDIIIDGDSRFFGGLVIGDKLNGNEVEVVEDVDRGVYYEMFNEMIK